MTYAAATGCPSDRPFKASWWASTRTPSGTPTAVECVASIPNFDTGSSPHPAVGADNFALTVEVSINLSGSMAVSASVTADDGVTCDIAGTRVVSGWKDQGATLYSGSITLGAGTYPVVWRFYEAGGGAVFRPTTSATPAASPTPSPTQAPTSTPTPSSTNTPTPVLIEDFQSGIGAWGKIGSTAAKAEGTNVVLQMNVPAAGAAETWKNFGTAALANSSAIELRINIACGRLIGGDGSAMYLDQGGWKYMSLSSYVAAGTCGWTTVRIPLDAFIASGFNKSATFSRLGFRIWNDSAIQVLLDDIRFIP